MKSDIGPKAIALALVGNINDDNLLWLIVSFVQGLIENDNGCNMLKPPRRYAWGFLFNFVLNCLYAHLMRIPKLVLIVLPYRPI